MNSLCVDLCNYRYCEIGVTYPNILSMIITSKKVSFLYSLIRPVTRLFKRGVQVKCVCTANGGSELQNKEKTFQKV